MTHFLWRWTLLLMCWVLSFTAQADSAGLLAQAKSTTPLRVQYAADNGAVTTATSDNKSFYLWWQPSTSKPTAVIVTIHGHASWAYDEFYILHSYAKSRGYAILALQWWFGGGEATADYYQPKEMYPLLAQVLRDQGMAPGSALFHGYSRGSANSYAMAALDTASGNRFFHTILSVAGGAISGYPPNTDIQNGVFGATPFSGVNWVMYCGMLDPNPDRDGCAAMRLARDWVIKYGANVKLLIEDAAGDHGGFSKTPANVDYALAQFAPANPYADAERIFNWAENQYPTLLTPKATSQVNYGYYYRCYSGNKCLGATLTDIYWYDKTISKLGTVANYLSQVK